MTIRIFYEGIIFVSAAYDRIKFSQTIVYP